MLSSSRRRFVRVWLVSAACSGRARVWGVHVCLGAAASCKVLCVSRSQPVRAHVQRARGELLDELSRRRWALLLSSPRAFSLSCALIPSPPLISSSSPPLRLRLFGSVAICRTATPRPGRVCQRIEERPATRRRAGQRRLGSMRSWPDGTCSSRCAPRRRVVQPAR